MARCRSGVRLLAPLRPRLHATLTAFVSLAVASACGFSNEVPPDASILCSSDDACPGEQRCDLVTHTCADKAQRPAAVTALFFDPPVANAGLVRLVLRADRALDPGRPAQIELSAASAALTFTLEATTGAEQRLIALVDEAAEGLYEVTSVEVSALDGPTIRQAVTGTTLVIDRTPPVLRNVRVTNAPADGVFADVAGRDTVEVRVLPSEPLRDDGATLLAGTTASACAPADGGELVCAAALTAATVADGDNSLVVVATDTAGNEATVDVGSIQVDLAAPRVVVDSAALSIRTGGVTSAAATATSVIDLSFVVTEDLGDEPHVVLDVLGQPFPFTLHAQVGRRYSLRLGGGGIPPGEYPVTASLVDRFGHSATVALMLPAPFDAGVPFSAGAPLSCPLPPGLACADLDGDGRFALSATCPDGDDFADDDFLCGPGATDWPGDGVDNNGAGGDAPIDESTGIFVDAEAGADANPGSRVSPVRTLDAALTLAAVRRVPWVYLADRATPYAAPSSGSGAGFLGGLDPLTWERTGGRSIVTGTIGGDGNTIDSIETDASIDLGGTSSVVRTFARRVFATHGVSLTMAHSEIELLLLSGTPSAVVSDSSLGQIQVGSGARLSLGRSRVRRGVSGSNTTIVAANSVFEGPDVVPIACTNCTLVLAHVTARGTGTTAVSVNGATLTLINSLIVAEAGGGDLIAGVRTFTGVASDLFHPSGPLLRLHSNVAIDLAALQACAFPDCLAAESMVSVDPGFATAFHLDAGSAVADLGVVDAIAEHGAPGSVASDFDRDCRYDDGTADIGADELP